MGGFRGDLSTLGLADIFQTLSNSQKEGTLVVGDGESRKCIYFGKEGLSLVSMGRRKGLRIGDLLLKLGKISPDQLKELLDAQKGTGKKLGEMIVERGIVSEEEISDAIRTQIEDEIFDLFNWKKASFEFIDGPPSPELTDADRPVTSLKFDVNSLLFEASRRIDEWGLINQAIPNPKTIFILTEEGEKLAEASTEPSVRAIARLTDASRTVDQIVDESGSSRFGACKALYTLLTKNGIRPVPQEELTALGKKLAFQGEPEKAIRVLSCAVELDSGNMAPQQEIAFVLRQLGRNDEAFHHYREMGKIYEGKGHLEEALQSYRQGLETRPDDGEGAYDVFRLLHLTKKNAEAAKMGEDLFPALLAAGDRARAREVGDIIVLSKPHDIDLRLRLAAICQDLGEQETCVRHLAAAIDHLPPGSTVDAEALCKKVLQVLPNRTDIRFKLERIFADRRAQQKKRMARLGIAGGVAVLGLVVGLFVWYEMQARRAWNDIVREADAFLVEKEWEKARTKYTEIQSRFPMSFVSRKAKDRINDVSKLQAAAADEARMAEDERRRLAAASKEGQRKRIGDAEQLESKTPPMLPEALKIYQEVLAWGEENREQEFIDRGSKEVRRLEEYLRNAASIDQTVQGLLKDKKVEEAHGRVLELVQKYPKSPQGLSAQLPYIVRSTPEGAAVYSGSQLLGKTPLTISQPPGKESEVLVQLKTFTTSRVKLQPKTPAVNVELEKECKWKHTTSGRIETTPIMDGGYVIIAGFDCRVYALQATNPANSRWSPFIAQEPGQLPGQIESTPALSNGFLYFGSNNGRVYCVDAKKGTRVWSQKTDGPVRSSPTVTEDGKTVVIGSDDGNLYALDTSNGNVRWRAPAGMAVQSRPYIFQGHVYFGSADGYLRKVDLATGDVRWKFQTGGAVEGAISGWNSFILAGSRDCHLYLIDLDGKLSWKYKTDKPVTGGASVSGDFAVFGNHQGFLFKINLKDGSEVWTVPFKAGKTDKATPIQGTPVLGDEAVYFGADDGYVYCVDWETGALRWRYETGDQIVASPTLGGGGGVSWLFVGSGDKNLYALER